MKVCTRACTTGEAFTLELACPSAHTQACVLPREQCVCVCVVIHVRLHTCAVVEKLKCHSHVCICASVYVCVSVYVCACV